MKIFSKVLLIIFAALFFLSAALQYNDPDPIHWIFLYGLAAVLCSMAVFGKFNQNLVYICIGATILQVLIVTEGTILWYLRGMENILSTPMAKDKPYIEEVREFFGSLIVLFANLYLLYFHRNKK
ncbi:MAG: transmembrane 220 family protein [Leptospira sp.]|nr:transmembrane 220 family protein [Leptospira sp.]